MDELSFDSHYDDWRALRMLRCQADTSKITATSATHFDIIVETSLPRQQATGMTCHSGAGKPAIIPGSPQHEYSPCKKPLHARRALITTTCWPIIVLLDS